jgi:hypothetical protein
MIPTKEQIVEWFTEYRETIFWSRVPFVEIKFINTKATLGWFKNTLSRDRTIAITTYWDIPECEYRRILLHEMCHLYCYCMGFPEDGHHGFCWKTMVKRVYEKTGLQITATTDESEWKWKPNVRKPKKV